MRIRRIFALLAILLPLTGLAQKMRFAEKFGNDSTVFTLSIDQKQKFEQGKTFEARIKVKQRGYWHLYSSKNSEDLGVSPLTLEIHPDAQKSFKVISFREIGKPVE